MQVLSVTIIAFIKKLFYTLAMSEKLQPTELGQRFQQAQRLRDNGSFALALKEYQEVRQKALSSDRLLASIVLHQSGVTNRLAGNPSEAIEQLEEAQQEFKDQKQPLYCGAVLRDIGLLELDQAEETIDPNIKDFHLRQASHALQRSVAVLERTGNPGHLGISQVKLGLVQAKRASIEEALRIMQEGIGNLDQSEEWFFKGVGYFDFAKTLMEAGNKVEARKAALRARRIIRTNSSEHEFLREKQKIKELLRGL